MKILKKFLNLLLIITFSMTMFVSPIEKVQAKTLRDIKKAIDDAEARLKNNQNKQVETEAEMQSVRNKVHDNLVEVDTIIKKIEKVDKVEECNYKGINELGESSILYLLEVKTNPQYKRQVKRDSLKQILLGLDEHKIEVPYNQLDIHEKK